MTASIPAAHGLDRGIKALSDANIWATMALTVFVLLTGPTLTLLRQAVDMTDVYLDMLPRIMSWTNPYNVGPN